ncbi:MAG: hypothetical protein JRH20_14085 [Deltaproteobacteria bacterium]|nr:hypothetical protein [Deltaproteobacteria bacterium]
MQHFPRLFFIVCVPVCLWACSSRSDQLQPDSQADIIVAEVGAADLARDFAPRPALSLSIACVDDADAVYAAQTTHADPLGAIVACVSDGEVSKVDLTAALAEVPDVEVRSGYRAYRVAYRTEREAGVFGTGTATLLVPDTPNAAARPVVVATHGTAGLADHCAPSSFPSTDDGQDALILPWVASGYVVIAPDYAGLGNPGVQGYGHAPDTAHSVLDAGRAAIAALAPGSVDADLVVAGHSQGGGAALSAQAFGASYGAPDVTLSAIISYAGNVTENRSLLGWQYPKLVPLLGGGGVTRAVVVLAFYSDFANLFGEARAGEVFHPDLRAFVVDAVKTKCIYGLTAALAKPSAGYVVPLTVANLVDPDLQLEMAECIRDTHCSARAEAYVARIKASDVVPDAQGAPVLMLGGIADAQSPPEKQACTRDYLQAHGVEPLVCQYPDRTHFDIVPHSAAFAVRWVETRLAGQTPPACVHATTLPACP